jgi:hypothetical protein
MTLDEVNEYMKYSNLIQRCLGNRQVSQRSLIEATINAISVEALLEVIVIWRQIRITTSFTFVILLNLEKMKVVTIFEK